VQFQQTLPSHLLTHAATAHQQGYQQWRVWTQDESRCGLLPIVRRRVTARGVQPLLSAAYRFESLYLYGAVEPQTGQSFFLELPTLNTEGFQIFLDHFAAAHPTEFHLLLLDNGAFHKAQALRLPTNVAFLFFPPSAPELNPIERLWRDLKDWLAQCHPTSLDELSSLLSKRLTAYSASALRSLTGFPYLLTALPHANGQPS
jgi:transposase